LFHLLTDFSTFRWLLAVCADGKENGFGTLTLPDGVKYRGQFQNGFKEGYGVMLWKTRTYDGEWAENKPHGQGRVVWSNGAVYTGQFQNGKYHGLGGKWIFFPLFVKPISSTLLSLTINFYLPPAHTQSICMAIGQEVCWAVGIRH
jgi:MORN repeat